MENINEKLRDAIDELDIPYRKVSQLSGVSKSTISNLVNGGHCKSRTAKKLAKALNCKPWEIGLMAEPKEAEASNE